MGAGELTGQMVGDRYRLGDVLGRGGMGVVYEGVQEALSRPVAVKVLMPALAEDAERVARFKAEAARAGALSHPHVVQVHDFGADPGGPIWIAMERLTGESLRERIHRAGRMGEAEALSVVSQMLRGLEAAHDTQLVHRDLKPDNVFLARTPGMGDVVKLLDFGIAKLLDAEVVQRLTSTGMIVGTPLYMAPEQLRGDDIDARTDIYGVGAVMFEMLAGRPPHEATSYHALLHDLLTRDAPPAASLRPDLDPRVAAIVDRAVARDPARRFESAAQMRAAVEVVTLGSQPPASVASSPAPAARAVAIAPTREARPERSRAPWIALGLIVLLLVLGAGGVGVAVLASGDPADATPPVSVAPAPTQPIGTPVIASNEQLVQPSLPTPTPPVAVPPSSVPALPAVEPRATRTSRSVGTRGDEPPRSAPEPEPEPEPTPAPEPERARAVATAPVATRRVETPPTRAAATRQPSSARVRATERTPELEHRQVTVRYSSANANGLWPREHIQEVGRSVRGDRCWPAGAVTPNRNRGDCFSVTASAAGVVTNVVPVNQTERPPGFYECMTRILMAVRLDPPEGRWGTVRICYTIR